MNTVFKQICLALIPVIQRLKKIDKLPHRLRPAQSSSIKSLSLVILPSQLMFGHVTSQIYTPCVFFYVSGLDQHRVSVRVCLLPWVSVAAGPKTLCVHCWECDWIEFGQCQRTVSHISPLPYGNSADLHAQRENVISMLLVFPMSETSNFKTVCLYFPSMRLSCSKISSGNMRTPVPDAQNVM